MKYLESPIFQIPKTIDQQIQSTNSVSMQNDIVCTISLEEAMSLDNVSWQSSPSDVPDFLNASYDTLQKMAGYTNDESLIFSNWSNITIRIL